MIRLVLLLFLTVPGIFAQTVNDETFAALERTWVIAYHQHDLSIIESLLTEDFVGIDGRGVISSRTDELNEAKPPQPGAPKPAIQILDEKISDVHARVYGEIAIVTALNTATVRTKVGENTIRYRRTTVWSKHDGGWRCVHFHASRVI